MQENKKFTHEMARIRLKFLEKIKGWLPQIQLFVNQLNNDSQDLVAIDQTRSKFHQLAGSGKTFGFPKITEIAKKIDAALEVLEKQPKKNLQKKNILELKNLFNEFFTLTKQVLEKAENLTIAEPESTELVNPRYKIFSVDDDDLVNDLLEHSLKKEGCLVISVERGYEVFEKLEKTIPDLIILDINMPGMNGLDVLRRLKSDPKYQHLPVIMLTKRNSNQDILAGFSFGATDYITKPFKIENLAARILKILHSRK